MLRANGGRSRKKWTAAVREYTEAPIRQGRLDNPWKGVVGGVVLEEAAHLERSAPSAPLRTGQEFFAAIAAQTKRIEYRERTPYWKERLEGRHYDVTHFRNGYDTPAPEMDVEFLELQRHGRGPSGYYGNRLGRILKIQRWKP